MILNRPDEILTTVTHADGGFYDSGHPARQGFYCSFERFYQGYDDERNPSIWLDEPDLAIEVVWGEDFWDLMGDRVINDSQ
jgi:hypothetical protein